jgi:hypothetical protein
MSPYPRTKPAPAVRDVRKAASGGLETPPSFDLGFRSAVREVFPETREQRCCWPSTTTPPSTGSTCRTTNPIESTFATVRLRERVTKGPGSRAARVAMAFKLIASAQTLGRAVNSPHLVALVRDGAVFKNGRIIERPDESEGGDQQVA